ncbi:hypothetical protein LOZ58_005984 [Ophidiomyces ophidiicola]|nr:hypothetical protein LOZ65_005674 [Ophidiomyces ophidiicola]KAI1934071.1 hypothetical protein LOZ66_006164 [Ophidiomyces ophidiicola]KAI1957062.1 hypothetical protein LOZ58_005984 [Ophidiomyces ophidiicola]
MNSADEDEAAVRQRTRRAHQEFVCLGMLKNIMERRGLTLVTPDDLRCLEGVLINSLRFTDASDRPLSPERGHPDTSSASQFRDIIFALPWQLRRELVEFFNSEPLEDNPYVERFRRGLMNRNIPIPGTRGSVFIDSQTGRPRVLQRPEVRVRR